MSAATMNEMERLRRERDDAFAKGRQVFDDLRRVEAERDALAAQLDRPRIKILGDLLKAGIEPENIFTSLARRDAEQRAEGMHRAVCVLESEFDPCHPIIERLEQMESEERRQSEESANGHH